MEPKPYVTTLYRLLSKMTILYILAEFSGFSGCLSTEKEPLDSY